MAKKILAQVMSSAMGDQLLDEDFVHNGSYVVFVDGKRIPGSVGVEYNPPQPKLNPIIEDARQGPVAELRSYGEFGELSVRCATQQAGVITRLLGMGTRLLSQPDVNLGRTVGDPLAVAAEVNDAEWHLVKLLGLADPYQAVINRTFFTDLEETPFKISAYDIAGARCVAVGTPPMGGVITLMDQFTGKFGMTDMTLAGAYKLVFDPSQVYMVKLGAERVAVDYIDPDLVPGEAAIILGIAYKHGQLRNPSDYSLVSPYERPHRVGIDLLMPLGDAPEGRVWKHKRFYWCESYVPPTETTSGDREEANILDYKFRVKRVKSRYKISEFCEEDFLIYPSTGESGNIHVGG
jgi:hypothetical protein